MSHNRAALAGDADSFPDWVELLNTGTETLSLDGLCLQCGERRWELPALTAQPGAYVLLLCEEDTAFSIPAEGESLSLLGAFSPRQRSLLLAGGLLNATREGLV